MRGEAEQKLRRRALMLTIALISVISVSLFVAIEWFNDHARGRQIIYAWPMFGHDPQRTGCTEGPAADITQLSWKYKTGGYVTSSPAVVDGAVYFGSWDNYIYSLDAKNGSLIWKYKTGGYVTSSPAVVDGRVFLGSTDHFVYCLDAKNGSLIWKCETGNSVAASQAFADDSVYTGSDDDHVYALDAKSGKVMLKYRTDGPVCSSPAVVDGKLYIGSDDDYVYCLGKGVTLVPPPYALYVGMTIVAIGITCVATYSYGYKRRPMRARIFSR